MKYGALISSSVRQWRVRQRVEGRKFFEEGVFRDNLEYEKVFFIWIEKGSIILGKSTACTKEPRGGAGIEPRENILNFAFQI